MATISSSCVTVVSGLCMLVSGVDGREVGVCVVCVCVCV